jgi:hypothetical protein
LLLRLTAAFPAVHGGPWVGVSRANPAQMDSFATTNLRLKQIDRAFSVNQCEPEMPLGSRLVQIQ